MKPEDGIEDHDNKLFDEGFKAGVEAGRKGERKDLRALLKERSKLNDIERMRGTTATIRRHFCGKTQEDEELLTLFEKEGAIK